MKKLFKRVAIGIVMPLIMGTAAICNAFAADQTPSKTIMKESLFYKKICAAKPETESPDCKGRAFIVKTGNKATFRADILCNKGRLESISLFDPNGRSLTTWMKKQCPSDMCAQDPAVAIKGFKAREAALQQYLQENGRRYKMPASFTAQPSTVQPK